MSGIDAFPQIVMGLVMLMVISYIGIVIVEKVATIDEVAVPEPTIVVVTAAPVATVAPPVTIATMNTVPPDFAQTVDDAVGWLPILIIAIVGGVALAAVFGMASFGYSPSPPEKTRTPARAPEPVWTPPMQPVESAWAPPTRVPGPVMVLEPTEDDLVARDPEIQAMNRDIQDIDAEIARLRDARKQHLADRSRVDRALLWLKRRSHRQEST